MYVLHTLDALGRSLTTLLADQDEVIIQGLGRFRRDTSPVKTRITFRPQHNFTIKAKSPDSKGS